MQRLAGTQAAVGARVDERIQPLSSSVDRLSHAIESESEKVDRQIRKIEGRMDTLAEDQQAYDNRLSVLAALMGRSEQGWSLAEVEYLLRIASQRLQLQRDVETAEVALESADARLRELADPHYLSVREQVAKDLEALGAVPDVDRDGIALTLGAWLERVDALPVAGVRYEPAFAGESTGLETTTTATSWKEIPALIWSALSELFQLREHDKPVTPMLAPEREYFLRENLRLQLSAARLALMRDDSGQYRAALETSRNWLGNYFSDENAEVAELTAKLEELLAVDIRPELPDLSGSLRLLRQQMKLSEGQKVLPLVPASQTQLNTGSEQAEDGASEVKGQ
jgi:uroporphyrin-3 C-methyltransferase